MLRGGGEESIPLLPSNTANVEYGGIEPKVHSGYGARRIPIKPSAGAGIAAGATQQRIFEGHLGAAAGDPNNPIGNWFHKQIYGDPVQRQDTKRVIEEEVDRGTLLPRDKIKPDSLNWNKETRAQYPEHWKLERKSREQKKSAERYYNRPHSATSRPQNPGLVLPFSNNIGPGNSIQPARTASDFIAQGHDLHYQDAKKPSDVLSADREAIGQFAQEAVSGSDPVSQLQALAGAAGLGAKHLVESLSGKVLYGNYYVFTLF